MTMLSLEWSHLLQEPKVKPMRKLLFPVLAAAFAATTLVTAAIADPLWSWGDDDWNHDAWSYRDWAYRPSGYGAGGYYGWGAGGVIAPYAYYPVPYRYADPGYDPYAAYPANFGYHFGFWGSCNC
jgi:hypothetical protein